MSIPNLFLLSSGGEVLIEKQWVGRIKRTICEAFWEETAKYSNRSEIPPVLVSSKYYFISTLRHKLTFLTVVTNEVPPLFILELHHCIIDTLSFYLSSQNSSSSVANEALTETNIRENFSLTLQLLDEMVDGAFPYTTELNQLKDMILPPSFTRKFLQSVAGESQLSQDLPSGALSKIPWRKNDVKYVTNEIYFDLFEQIDAILGPNQQVVHANIFGEIRVGCHLSGMPDLTLSFTRPNLLEDVSLHRCVRINRYLREKVISFVPPDGPFTLLKYKISGGIQFPIYVKPMVSYNKRGGTGKVQIMVGPKFSQDKAVTNVVLHIPFPPCMRSASLTCNVGVVKLDSMTNIAKWDIGRLPKEKTPILEGSMNFPADFMADEYPVIRAEFAVKMLASSGLKVDGLAIRGVNYKPFKGVRSHTSAGKFQVRCVE